MEAATEAAESARNATFWLLIRSANWPPLRSSLLFAGPKKAT
jgi:hypothetical protein